MTTWAEYRSKLETWSKRATTSGIPIDDCMLLAYQRVSQDIQPAALDIEVVLDPDTATAVRGKVHSYTLPIGFLRVWRLTNNGLPVRRYQPDALQQMSGSAPFGHAVVGANLWVAPGAGGDLRLIYNKQDPQPTEEETNYGLTNYLDAYIHAGRLAIAQFAEDADRKATAADDYNSAQLRINEIENGKRRSGAGQAA